MSQNIKINSFVFFEYVIILLSFLTLQFFVVNYFKIFVFNFCNHLVRSHSACNFIIIVYIINFFIFLNNFLAFFSPENVTHPYQTKYFWIGKKQTFLRQMGIVAINCSMLFESAKQKVQSFQTQNLKLKKKFLKCYKN
jgi:hypothetical protein